MNGPKRLALLVIALLAALLSAASVSAEPIGLPQDGANVDDVPHPLGEQKRANTEKAVEMVLQGKAQGPIVQVAKGQYVELAREDEDLIWTVTAEFGDTPSPYDLIRDDSYTGPLHNQIPEPDRSEDNTTIWTDDFSQAYYENLLFSTAPGARSMSNYYIENSSNRYTVDGDVTDWAQVPYNLAHYGRDYCGGIVCANTWFFITDSVNAWYQDQLDAGMTTAEIDAYLAKFDVWDRYDHDGDGNFNEPDGYIDHFQSVHAGQGQETGGGQYGSDQIWSHRWYVQSTPIGSGGPTLDDGSVVPFGGTRVGGSKYWIGDYTIEPENGGVGVFVHEFGHDLDLPDLYDTSGNTCPPGDAGCAENSTGFWTLMSSGSYGNDGTIDLGTKPTHLGAWEKLQLGWLDYEVAFAGQRSIHRMGPAETSTKQAQAVFVVLPDKQVSEVIGTPVDGEAFYYSGQGNDLDNLMYFSADLSQGNQLTAQVDYDIEVDWDYAYLVVSEDGGATWNEVATNVSTDTSPNGQNFGYGITGSSGGWTELTADLSAYSGQVLVGFRYWTDGAVIERGFSVDSISVAGLTVGAETGDPAVTLEGFTTTTGIENASYFNAYVLENRVYQGFDDALRTGAYNFGWANTRPDYVERFSYQDGLLISYWDSSQTDNNTSSHPGEGLVLPVDAHPKAMIRGDDGVWRARVQSYDSTFGLDPTDALTLHWYGVESQHPSLPAVSTFDDANSYWDPAAPQASVKVPDTGTQVIVRSTSARGAFMQVEVRPRN